MRFTATASLQAALASVAGSRLARLLPAGLLLTSLVCATVALAGPRISHRVPIGNASLVLVLDHSGSMDANDVSPTRIQAAIAAANTFIGELPSSARVGAVAFGSQPDAAQQPTTDHAAAEQLIDSQQANGGTDTGPALQLALQLLHGTEKGHPPSAIVLLSDGAANLGISPVTVAQVARQEGIPIYTVALGTPEGVLNEGPFNPSVPVPPDPQLMAQIAKTSGGKAFDAQTADQLSSIYAALGSKLSSLARKRDVTVEFALAAGVFLLLGGVASGRLASRIG